MNAWCDANGNWGISNDVSDCQRAYVFRTEIEFGHIENRDSRTFTAIVRHTTQAATVGTDDSSQMIGMGLVDVGIQANFDKINAVRPTIVFGNGNRFPDAVGNDVFLAATPGQPYRQ